MSHLLKQSQTAEPLLFLMVDSTNHIDGKTGLSPTVALSKNGGAFASPAGAVTELANGWYQVAGNATDTNTLGPLILHATGTGADPVDMKFEVVAFDPRSATNLGLSNLDAAISSRSSHSAADVWSVGTRRVTNLDDTRAAKIDNLDAAISSRSTYAGGAVASVTGAVGSVASPVTVGTNNDKTGYALSVTPPTAAQNATAVRTELATELGRIDAPISGASTFNASSDAVTVGAINANAVNASALAADAVAEIQSGLSTLDATAAQAANAAALAAYNPPTRAEATADKNAVIAALPSEPDNATIAAIGADYARRTGDYAAVADLPDVSGLSTFNAATDTVTLATPPPTAGDIATAVWASGTRTLTGFGSLVADVAAAVWSAATRTLSAFGFTVDTNANATEQSIATQTAKIDDLTEDDSGVWRFTANALEQAPAGGGGAGGYTSDDRTRDAAIYENTQLLRLSEPDPPEVVVVPAPENANFVNVVVDSRDLGAFGVGVKYTATLQGAQPFVTNGTAVEKDGAQTVKTNADGRAIFVIPKSSVVKDATGATNLPYKFTGTGMGDGVTATVDASTTLAAIIEAAP